jgi:hypothetical protein
MGMVGQGSGIADKNAVVTVPPTEQADVAFVEGTPAVLVRNPTVPINTARIATASAIEVIRNRARTL